MGRSLQLEKKEKFEASRAERRMMPLAAIRPERGNGCNCQKSSWQRFEPNDGGVAAPQLQLLLLGLRPRESNRQSPRRRNRNPA
jgi:hypothetical protein